MAKRVINRKMEEKRQNYVLGTSAHKMQRMGIEIIAANKTRLLGHGQSRTDNDTIVTILNVIMIDRNLVRE